MKTIAEDTEELAYTIYQSADSMNAAREVAKTIIDLQVHLCELKALLRASAAQGAGHG